MFLLEQTGRIVFSYHLLTLIRILLDVVIRKPAYQLRLMLMRMRMMLLFLLSEKKMKMKMGLMVVFA